MEGMHTRVQMSEEQAVEILAEALARVIRGQEGHMPEYVLHHTISALRAALPIAARVANPDVSESYLKDVTIDYPHPI